MTVQMQEIIERVQTLPRKKQNEIADVISRLLNILSDEDTYSDDEITVYVESDLTGDERAAMAAARKEHEEYPEGSISLDDFMVINGITEESLKNLSPVKIVYG
jgi:hypothetical protein